LEEVSEVVECGERDYGDVGHCRVELWLQLGVEELLLLMLGLEEG
jgi:hypothetical protein